MNDVPPDQQGLQSVIDGAGPIAGLFVLLLLGAVVLLWWSMNRQLKRIDPALKAGPDDLLQARDSAYTAEAVARGQEQDAQGQDAQQVDRPAKVDGQPDA